MVDPPPSDLSAACPVLCHRTPPPSTGDSMKAHATQYAGHVSTVLAAALMMAISCRGGDSGGTSDSAAGVAPADTTQATASLTPAAPAPQPTAEDAKDVRDALEFKLTEDNLNKFIKAGSSLAFLRAP